MRWKSGQALAPDLGPDWYVCCADRDPNLQQEIWKRTQQDGKCQGTAGAGPHSQGRWLQGSWAIISPIGVVPQLEAGGQSTQVAAAGLISIGQDRWINHVQDWCGKSKCPGTARRAGRPVAPLGQGQGLQLGWNGILGPWAGWGRLGRDSKAVSASRVLTASCF